MKSKNYKKKVVKKTAKVAEPMATYTFNRNKKVSVAVFNSFEEMSQATAKENASLSYDQRMENLEFLRKQVYNKFLHPDGSWPVLEKVFKIMLPYVTKAG